MFGGNGYDAEGASVTFRDLWRLSPESSGPLLHGSKSASAARVSSTSITQTPLPGHWTKGPAHLSIPGVI